MDKRKLEQYLADGLTLERIGEIEKRHPATIGYWLKQHGLKPAYETYGRRMGLRDEDVRPLVAQGLTLAQMAERLGTSTSTVRRAIDRYNIERPPRGRRQLALAALARGEKRFGGECRYHGLTTFLAHPDGKSRCSKCNSEAVSRCRRKRKDTLASEAGGKCRRCGYDEFLAALQFHHLDPEQKEFGIAEAGVTRSLERCREEAKKCILLCANCHSAFEAGLIDLPLELEDEDEPE